MKVCSFCGERNEDWMNICQKCGNSINVNKNNEAYNNINKKYQKKKPDNINPNPQMQKMQKPFNHKNDKSLKTILGVLVGIMVALIIYIIYLLITRS